MNKTESEKAAKIRWKQNHATRERELEEIWDMKNCVYKKFYQFVIKHEWPIQHLTWKTHIPLKTEEKVQRACATCAHYESVGLKLWWMRRNLEPDLPSAYDCTHCFYTWNPEHIVPVKYEGLALWDAVTAMQKDRKQHVKSALSAVDKSH